MFPTSHDLFPEHLPEITTVLGKLLTAGNSVLITTKPRIRVIYSICEQFARYKKQMQFRFTITSIDDEILRKNEPGATTFGERLRCLRHAYEFGFKTSVSIEPFLDENPLCLVENISPFVTESIWIGPMNHVANSAIYSKANLRNMHAELKDHPLIRFKDAFLNKMQ